MAVQSFRASSSNQITTQPSAATKLIARSSSAADTGNISRTGLVSGTSTTEGPTALLGQREVQSSNSFTTLTNVLLSAAQAGTVSIYQAGTAGTAFLRGETNPADATTLTFGLTGFTQAYRFKNTTSAAYDVKIGATLADTMTNLKKAINADGAGDGTDYHTGTAANPFLSASVSGTEITLTDRVAVSRQLTWSFAQSASHFSLPATISGGVTGTLLATLTAGVTQLFNSFTLSSADLGTDTLPALVAPTTNAINVGGRQCSLQFKCENVTTPIALAYQTSTDGTNWSQGSTSISNLDNNTALNPYVVVPDEKNIEYIRLVFSANANTTDTALDAVVIY